MSNEKLKILLADDEQEIRESMESIIRELGYTVDSAAGGEEAIKLIESNYYDIYIIDIHMPKLSGIDVLKKTRAMKPEANFIMITGYGDEQSAIDCLNNGAFAYLRKPVLWQELEITIDRCIRHEKLLHNRKLLEGVLMTVRNFEHSINNPLTIILGNAELLQMKFEDDPETLELVDPIIESSEDISNHIQDLKEVKEIKVWDYIGGKMLETTKKRT